ncbi:hypothetical protein FOZ63_020568, partial [Perkinsus olseni]
MLGRRALRCLRGWENPDFVSVITLEGCSTMTPSPRRPLNAVLLVWCYLYSIRAASRDREVLTENREFMRYSEPRESQKGKKRSRLTPEGRELTALRRDTVVGFGRANGGRNLQVWLGFDVTGIDGRQRKLTDF